MSLGATVGDGRPGHERFLSLVSLYKPLHLSEIGGPPPPSRPLPSFVGCESTLATSPDHQEVHPGGPDWSREPTSRPSSGFT